MKKRFQEHFLLFSFFDLVIDPKQISEQMPNLQDWESVSKLKNWRLLCGIFV